MPWGGIVDGAGVSRGKGRVLRSALRWLEDVQYTANDSHVVVIVWHSFPCKRNTVLLGKGGGWMIANRSSMSLCLHYVEYRKY